MQLLPAQEDVVRVLTETGALRRGHFAFPGGLHSSEYLQVPLAMRYYQHAKMLSVGLSRLMRANTEIRTVIPELSVVAPAPGGLPVAHGICEALQARQVYWAEREGPGKPYRFRPFVEPQPGEQVILADDALHSGANLTDLKAALESRGAIVLGLAVIVYQPTLRTHDFGKLPLYHLARLEASYYADGASCELCKRGEDITKVWV
jgi:orotate phosphoribosyltransferase